MRYFIVCLLLIVGCKSGKDSRNSDTIIGTAVNDKAGAILSNNDKIFLIAGLKNWDRIYLNKRVKVKGSFTFIDEKDFKTREKLLVNTLQTYPKLYSVKNATWELYPNVVIGTAIDTKAGAMLRSKDGAFLIAGLRNWDSIYLYKTVKVKGTLNFVEWEVDRVKSENAFLNSLQAQVIPKYYSVSDATWELHDAD